MTTEQRIELERKLSAIVDGHQPELDKDVMAENGEVLPNSHLPSDKYKVFIDVSEERSRPIFNLVSALFNEEEDAA